MKSRIMLFLGNLNKISFPDLTISGIIELAILFLLIYNIVKAIRDTRAWVVFKGIIFILISYLVFNLLNFYVLTTIIKSLSGVALIAIVTIFSDNIRKMFERIGQKNILSNISKITENKKKEISYVSIENQENILRAVEKMSSQSTGALIVLERDAILKEYAETGISINAKITSEVIENIFIDKSPLHDGAMIITDNKIAAATSYLPISRNPDIDKDMGTRHRAAIGLTEVTDAIVVIVSEETGSISYSKDGDIKRHLTINQLRYLLNEDLKIETVDRKISPKDIIFSNISNKLIALGLSFVIWFSYMNIISPPITKIIENVPYEMINAEVIEENGKIYDSMEKDQVINVSISGEASQVNAVKRSDIKAYVDLTKISISNASKINVSIPKYPNLKIDIPEGDLINLSIDDLAEAEWSVSTRVIKEPSNGEIFDTIHWDNNLSTVKISGPKNKINKIGEVSILLDLSKVRNNQTISQEIDIFDKNGEKMNKQLFKINRPVLTGVVKMNTTKTVPTNIDIKVKDDLPISIKEVDYDPAEILIAGEESLLEQIDYINIPIEISEKDIKENIFTIIKNINIEDYLDEKIEVSKDNKIIKVVIVTEFNESLQDN